MLANWLLLATFFWLGSCVYHLQVTYHGPEPVVSLINPEGQGSTPCNLTFNPSWIPTSPGMPETGLFVRVAECPEEYGGQDDHIMFIPCDESGKCTSLQKGFSLEKGSEDPRVVLYKDTYYNYYYAPGSGQSTVKVASTKTPLNASSWIHLATLPWHRNGCVLLREQPPHYVLYGEGPPPLPGIGLATTEDFVHYTTINDSFLLPRKEFGEMKLEAGSPPVQLSTGDYLHFYAVATPEWDPPLQGNYTAAWVILDQNDPSHIVQRSAEFILVPTYDYEIGNPPYPWSRKSVIFLPSAVPTQNDDEFRLWFGAADANTGTAIVKVTHD